MVPEGWQEIRLGELFESRRERGRRGLPTMSVTLYDGLVPRNSLDRKTETSLSAEEHLLIREGDIAYNMMRMWQGASGLATCDAIVSPAYVVLKLTSKIDPLFASYFFKFKRTIHLFWAYSYGLTKDRLRLYYHDFALIPAVVPPVHEQRRIGQLLSTWDRYIEILEKLIESSQHQMTALMQRFFPSHLTSDPTVELGSLGTFRKGKGISSDHLVNEGLPCVRYGELYTYHHNIIRSFVSYISPDSVKLTTKLQNGDLLFAGSGETPEEIGKCAAFLGDHDAYAGGDIIIFSPTTCDPTFLAYQLNSHSVVRQRARFAQGHSVVHISAGSLAQIKLRLPTLDEQKRIAEILDHCERIISEYEQQRVTLVKEKHALMQQLLTGKRHVSAEDAVESAYA